MTLLGRRRHARFLLGQPIDATVRVCEEVDIEAWDEREMVILSHQPCRVDERFAIEVPGDARARMHVRVSECGSAVTDDGALRHRVRLLIESYEASMASTLEEASRDS
jgi:hypothetical protein